MLIHKKITKKFIPMTLSLLFSVSPMCFAQNQMEYYQQEMQSQEIINVDSEGSLKVALMRLQKTSEDTEIVLTKDILLKESITIDVDAKINLNGFRIDIVNPSAQINIGKKSLVERRPYQVYHEGHWETKAVSKQTNSTTWNSGGYYYNDHCYDYYPPIVPGNNVTTTVTTEYQDVWVPGYYTTKYEDVYKWHDDIRVSIYNGDIVQASGATGISKHDAYWKKDANGGNGMSPSDTFKLISGNLNLNSVSVHSGSGGQGGDATYSAVWHVPFGGGDGGHGGNGGNGANIFNSDHGNVSLSKNCRLIPGNAGMGGRGSGPNPNYWVISGKTGRNGKMGRAGKYINDTNKLIYY